MRKLALSSMAALVLLAAGCGDEGAPVEIENDLVSFDIMEIYIYPDSTPLRGFNLLSSPLQPGESFVTAIAPGVYQIAVIDEDGDSYHYGDLMIISSGYELRVGLDDLNQGTIHAGDGSAPFAIKSGLGESTAIYYAYVSMTASNWGDDRLRSTIMLPGEELVVWVTPGTWSAKVESDMGATDVIEDVVVGREGYSWSVTESDRSSFR